MSRNKDREEEAEGREGRKSLYSSLESADLWCLEMAGAMMVERAQNLPSMAFTDPKEYLAR